MANPSAAPRPVAAATAAEIDRSLLIEVSDPDTAQTHCLELELGSGRVYQAVVHSPRVREDVMEQVARAPFAAIVPASGGLIANLKVWENLALPAAYHGSPHYAELERRAADILAEFDVAGVKFEALCSMLPDHLDRFERRLCAFVRALLTEPRLLLYDSVFDGLNRKQTARVLTFDAAYRRRVPQGTSLYLSADMHSLPDVGASHTFHL